MKLYIIPYSDTFLLHRHTQLRTLYNVISEMTLTLVFPFLVEMNHVYVYKTFASDLLLHYYHTGLLLRHCKDVNDPMIEYILHMMNPWWEVEMIS